MGRQTETAADKGEGRNKKMRGATKKKAKVGKCVIREKLGVME